MHANGVIAPLLIAYAFTIAIQFIGTSVTYMLGRPDLSSSKWSMSATLAKGVFFGCTAFLMAILCHFLLCR